MDVKFLSKFFAVITTMLLSVSLYAQENEAQNLYKDCNVLLGVGTFYYQFSGEDDFRKRTGLLKDEIKGMGGLYFNAELLLNDTFSLSLPFGLAAGYRISTMEGGYEYSTFGGDTLERKVQIVNNIGYANIFIPLDDDKYWLIGASAGLGISSYKYSLMFSNSATTDVEESSRGTIIPLSIFLDWGADGIGGRLGFTYTVSKYPDIDGVTPDGDGGEIFIELRYAI